MVSPARTLRYDGRETTANNRAFPSSMHVHLMPTLKRHMASLHLVSQETLGTFIFKNIQRQDGNEKVNKNVHHAFLCISFAIFALLRRENAYFRVLRIT